MKTIGRTDKADFPELGVEGLEVKIDTGAYTSSMHCHEICEVEEEGIKFVQFKILDPSHHQYEDKVFRAVDYKIRKVKSSTGISEERYSIKTKIVLFQKRYRIELTLSDRKEMRFPILLGRKFLSKKFIVDPAQKDISYNYIFKMKKK